MKITNVSALPHYISYAGKVGRTLPPDGTTAELPLTCVFNKVMWQDIESNRLQFKLSDEDKAFIAKLLLQDARPIIPRVVVAKPSNREKAAIKAKAAHDAKIAAEAKRKSLAGIRMNPGGATGQPSFGQPNGPAIPKVLPGQAVSLDQLKAHNSAVPRRNPAAVQPVPAKGTGKPKAESLADAASILGGLV